MNTLKIKGFRKILKIYEKDVDIFGSKSYHKFITQIINKIC